MPVKNLQEPLIAAVIIGNGFTHARANRYKVHFPSITGISQTAFNAMDLHKTEKANVLEWDGSRFVWGENVYTESRLHATTMGAEKAGSVTHKRLMLAALYELFGAQDVTVNGLITTFPVLDYSASKDLLRSKLAGTYSLKDGNGREFIYTIPNDAVKVLPEGLPTVYDALYNDAGNVTNEKLLGQGVSIGVVNIGTYTTDLIFVSNQKPNAALSNSSDVGLSKVWDEIMRVAKVTHKRSLTLHEADTAMKQGFYMTGNQRRDCGAVVEEMMEQIAETVAGEINRLWDNGAAVNHLIFAGGGAPHLNAYLSRRYPNNELYTFGTPEAAASTEMNGAYKVGFIKLVGVK